MSPRERKPIVALVPRGQIGGIPIVDATYDARREVARNDEAMLERSHAMYPRSSEMAAAWLRAVVWMRSRAHGSIWILDGRISRK